jgi:hypothetical protein
MALWLFVVVACGYFSLRAPAPASVVNDATITLDEYEQLRIGMSYKECVNALGATGYQQDLTYIRESRLTITTYIWQNQDGSNVMAEFENGRLTTKVQAGLHTPKPVVQQQLLYGATAPFFPDYALEGPSSSPRRGAPHDHSPLSPSR